MMERIAETSPRLKARVAGSLYLSGVLNLFAGAVVNRLVVNRDAAATTHNIPDARNVISAAKRNAAEQTETLGD
jgi:hypothetical protein